MLAGTSGLSFTTGSNGAASFTVSGTVANLNTALNGLTYHPTTGSTSGDSLGITISDSDGLSDTDSVGLSITAATAPTVSAPADATLTENGSVVFSSANGNAITVTDASEGTSSDSLTLSVGRGTLTLGSTSGVTVTGNGNASVTVSGTASNLNTALNGLTYRPGSGDTGSDTLNISISDSTDGLKNSGSVSLTINAAVAPAISAPTTASASENGSVTFSKSNGNAITATDASAGTSTEKLALSATHGTLRLATTSGITIVSGANRSASMTISGTLTNLNAALNGIIFTPTSRFTGSASIALTLTDSGDSLSGSATISVTVSRSGRAVRTANDRSVAVPINPAFDPSAHVEVPSSINSATAAATFDTDNSTPVDAQTQWEGFLAALELLVD